MFKIMSVKNAFLVFIVTVFLGCGTTPDPNYTIPRNTRLFPQGQETEEVTKEPATATAVKAAPPTPSPETETESEPESEEEEESQEEMASEMAEQDEQTQDVPETEETQITSDAPPDLGRRLPSLFFSEDLGLYVSPNAQYDVFFHDNYWYVLSGQTWYRSKNHRGPWEKINLSSLPQPLLGEFASENDDQ